MLPILNYLSWLTCQLYSSPDYNNKEKIINKKQLCFPKKKIYFYLLSYLMLRVILWALKQNSYVLTIDFTQKTHYLVYMATQISIYGVADNSNKTKY